MAERQTLPSIDLISFEGLYTKLNPETLKPTQLRECKNCDFFREYGSMSKLRGNKRLLNTVYTENSTPKSISWGKFYKSQELSGEIIRRIIIQTGTKIQKLNSNGTLTSLRTGEPDGLFRTSSQLDRFMYITGQNPIKIGDRGSMLKYDGTKVSEWGLTAPGSIETSIETFDDSSIFTTSNCTLSDENTIAWKNDSTKMVKGTSSAITYFEQINRSPFGVNNVTEDRARVQLYIPRDEFSKLKTSGRTISIYFGSDANLTNNYYRYDFRVGQLIEGWNTLIMDFSTYPSGNFGTTIGTPVDSALRSIRFECITNNASDAIILYWDHLHSLDQGTPTIGAFGGAGGSIFPQSSSSTWSYKITFIDEAGNESNAGPASVDADNTTGSTDYGSLSITDIPTSSNSAVIKRNIYRTLAGGSEWLYHSSINDNITTIMTDITSDGALGSTTPPLLGDAIFDHEPPPSCGITVMWKRTAFLAGDPLNPHILYYSRYDLPDAFPLANAIELDERITGMFVTYLGMVVATETGYWRILGDNPDYTVDRVIDGMGCIGSRAIGTARMAGWVVDRDGFRLYDLRDTIKISEVIRDRVDAFNKVNLEDTHTGYSKANNSLLWFIKDSDGIYTDRYNYQHMIDDIRTGWYSQIITNPTTLDFIHTFEVEDDNGDPHYYAGSSDGMLYELFADDSLNWVNASGQERAMTMEFWTAFMRLGLEAGADKYYKKEPFSGRVQPILIELRAKENTGAAHTWTVTIESSDSASENATIRDSKEITFEFPAGVSLLRLGIQDLTSAEYIRLKVKNEQKDKDLSLMGIKLYYHIKEGQFIVAGYPAGQN